MEKPDRPHEDDFKDGRFEQADELAEALREIGSERSSTELTWAIRTLARALGRRRTLYQLVTSAPGGRVPKPIHEALAILEIHGMAPDEPLEKMFRLDGSAKPKRGKRQERP